MSLTTYAHTAEGRDWEPLEDHLEEVAGLAGRFAAAFGSAEWGRLAGLWHDLGKYSSAFQDYLVRSNNGDLHLEELSGRVDHSTAGAQHAAKQGQLGRLLAYCIAGHHAGLPDNEAGHAGLSMRLQKQIDPFDTAPPRLLLTPLPSPPKLRPARHPRLGAFSLAFYTRMLFSCLVDADFLATERFMSPQRAAMRPCDGMPLSALREQLELFLETKQRQAPDTIVNRCRRDVLHACRQKAQLAPGIFSLNVPTGAGKTLSSLAFGLAHAESHELRRIIYAIPFTSIIEQTAEVFREAMGDSSAEILEHHSNLDPDDPACHSLQSRLAAENFDAPIIVTTNVQLFESLFASRPSRCRKLHRLARSVIILDEAQTLPPNLLAPTLAALDELVLNYACTVVLCTATQPAIEIRDSFPIGLEQVVPIVDAPQKLHATLRRTQVEQIGLISDEQLTDRLRAETQVLCIVNSRRHAADLFNLLNDPDALHLSARMCAAHRSDIVKQIRQRLDSGGAMACRVISTQVIEAGVDVDFPVVFRAAAGLDSIAQAAGRCNREGALMDQDGQRIRGRVYVYEHDETQHRPPPFIARAAAHYREVAPDHVNDLLAPDAIHDYFRLHYWSQGGTNGQGWDAGKERLSIMDCFARDPKIGLHAQFRQAAERYQMIDDTQTSILVPYGETGRTLIAELAAMACRPDPTWLRGFDRRAQRYIVGVRESVFQMLLGQGVLFENVGRFCLANQAGYSEAIGLILGPVGMDPGMLVI